MVAVAKGSIGRVSLPNWASQRERLLGLRFRTNELGTELDYGLRSVWATRSIPRRMSVIA